MKTNTGLVQFVKQCVGRPYIFGTFGQKLTKSLIESKANQYPKLLTKARKAYALENYLGMRSDDCIGLIKNYLWANSPDENPVYNSAEDWSADAAFKRATEKGPISTMPDLPGMLVRYSGHVGVYIGGGEVIEARGFDYGVVKTALNGRKWTDWYKHPLITYESGTGANTGDLSDVNTPNNTQEITYTVKKGDTLTAIAKKYNVTVGAIVALNGLNNPDLIRVGQKLKITLANTQTQNSPISAPNSGISKNTAIVSTQNTALNLRAAPNGQIIGSIPKGASVEIIDTNNNAWFKVKYNNRTGYCSSKYLRV